MSDGEFSSWTMYKKNSRKSGLTNISINNLNPKFSQTLSFGGKFLSSPVSYGDRGFIFYNDTSGTKIALPSSEIGKHKKLEVRAVLESIDGITRPSLTKVEITGLRTK